MSLDINMGYNISTTQDTSFYEHWYSPHTDFKRIEPNVIKLPDYYSFDLEKVRSQVNSIQEDHGYKPFEVAKNKRRLTYQGIGLTAKPGAEDPLYDALNLYGKDGKLSITEAFETMGNANDKKAVMNLAEKDFSEPTEIFDGYIKEVLSKFKSPLTKTRLLNLKRKGVLAPHVDFPYYEQIRVHACIFESPDAWWEVEGERFKIPADGNFYWFDTGKYHAVWNDGADDRVVLSVNLSVYQDRNGKPPYTAENKFEDLVEKCLI